MSTMNASTSLFMFLGAVALLVPAAYVPQAVADESLAGKACRSVHLGYQAPPGDAFYAETQVEQSAAGSYFMVCGWNTGYFGIQEIRPGRKVVIFSVWDPTRGNDPGAVDPSQRVGILHEGEGVRVSRFGGEGTGGKSMFDFDWQVGQTYRCLVTATANEKRTEYAGYFYLPDQQRWKHLVTFSTITGGKPLKGYYSFVEDFRRNGRSAQQARVARFGNVWVRDTKGAWQSVRRARFTGDANPATNIDAGQREASFYLATGGDTQNSGRELRSFIDLQGKLPAQPPTDLPIPNASSSQKQAAEFSFDGADKVAYQRVGDVALHLHVFKPEGWTRRDRRAAIVFFFGGGWNGGTPAQFVPQCQSLAKRGMVAITAEYRVKSRHGVEPQACVVDGRAAVRWVRQHAQEWGIDNARIAAAGGSAGGHVAASTATLDHLDTSSSSVRCEPNALILYNPVCDTTLQGYGGKRLGAKMLELSPVHHLHRQMPPTVIFHGEADKTVPLENVQRFKRLMQELGNDCDLVTYPNAGHGFFNPGRKGGHYEDTMRRTIVFLANIGFLESPAGPTPQISTE